MKPVPSRRRLLLALSAALLPPTLHAQGSEPLRWADVRLLDGRTLTAGELNGRAVVVYMWASWCPFYRTEKAATDYLAKHGYSFANAMATPQLAQWFGPRRTLPEVYVVQGGRVVFRESGEMFAEDVAALARFGSR